MSALSRFAYLGYFAIAIAAFGWTASAPAQPADEPLILVAKPALRDNLYGATILVAKPLGNNQPVAPRDQQRSPNPGDLRDPLERGFGFGHCSLASHSRASRAARSAMRPSRAMGKDGSLTVSSIVSDVGATR